MSSFTERIAVMQACVDAIPDGAGLVDMDNFTTHAHQSMVQEGYIRPVGSPKTVHELTWNGYRWAKKMYAQGYITTDPPAPTQTGVDPQPPETCGHCGCPCPCDCHASTCPPAGKVKNLKLNFTGEADAQANT